MRLLLAAALPPLFLVACTTSSTTPPPAAPTPIPQAWLNIAAAESVSATQLCEQIHCRARDAADVRIEGHRLMRGDKALTPEFKEIESFDVSSMRKEVVFSAKRDDNFDVGLVSIDGSDVHWVPSDPADETSVQWGTRPNTVSYVVHLASGDAVRVVHVASSIQFLAGFPYSAVESVAWNGERMSVLVSSVDSSAHVESMKFNTQERRMDGSPSIKLDVMTEPIGGGVLLRPPTLRYGEKLPFVVWIADDYGWSDARASLLRNARVACAVMRNEPDEAFWQAMTAMRWIDESQIFLVAKSVVRRASVGPPFVITADPSLPLGTYRISGSTVSAPPAVVQSVAVGFIADHLKGTAAGNGSHR